MISDDICNVWCGHRVIAERIEMLSGKDLNASGQNSPNLGYITAKRDTQPFIYPLEKASAYAKPLKCLKLCHWHFRSFTQALAFFMEYNGSYISLGRDTFHAYYMVALVV